MTSTTQSSTMRSSTAEQASAGVGSQSSKQGSLPSCIYVVGVGRSGTTLLMMMLDAHSKISFMPENFILLTHLLKAPTLDLGEARRRFEADVYVERLGISLDELLRPFEEGERRFSMAAFYRRMIELFRERTGSPIIGDKAPKYVECISLLSQLEPNSRLIHIIRDPRDVYLSRTKAGWSEKYPVWAQLLAYRAQYSLGRQEGKRWYGDRYHELRYEQLLDDPEQVLRELCQFIGVSFEGQMLNFAKSAERLLSKQEMPWQQLVAGPLVSQNKEKWRRELSPRTLKLLDAACWPVIRDGMYLDHTGGRRLSAGQLIASAAFGGLALAYNARLAWQNARARKKLMRSLRDDDGSAAGSGDQ